MDYGQKKVELTKDLKNRGATKEKLIEAYLNEGLLTKDAAENVLKILITPQDLRYSGSNSSLVTYFVRISSASTIKNACRIVQRPPRSETLDESFRRLSKAKPSIRDESSDRCCGRGKIINQNLVTMKKKVLLMGKSGSGKTSMRSIIFANYIARDTRRLGATIDVEHSHVRFLGNLVLNLWDCGGQEAFMENYFASQRDNIFRNVEVLIYVFDVESREMEKDTHYYQSCLEAILQNSPEARIFCLVHKMDLIPEESREEIFKDREEELKLLSKPLECTCFRTSIWDETLYKAWSSIVYKLIPNVKALESSLKQFASIVDADEVLLFERATFLVVSHCQRRPHRDAHRFEKVSNIVKQFKLSCSKLAAQFQSMEVRNSVFAAFIDGFTSNTYVMVEMSDPRIPSEATLVNIRNARKHFEKLEKVSSTPPAHYQ